MGRKVRDAKRPGPGLVVRASVWHDPIGMAERMRIEDKAEVVAASGHTPLQALAHAFLNSEECYTVDFNGKPSAMFGCVPSEADTGVRLGTIWLLGTDDIPLFTWPFLRNSRTWLDRVCEGFDIVGNFVDERNKQHVKWLRWLKFTFVARHPEFGHLGLPFLEFVKIVEK